MGTAIQATCLHVQGGPSDGLSFTVAAGEIHALLGPAGAGKTSLLETAAGLRRPLSGTIRVKGVDPYDRRAGLRLGSVWRDGGLFPGLTPAEIVDSWRRWSLDPLTREEALLLTGLTGRSTTPFERLDAGERRLLDLTLALVNRSDVLFLDDPMAGLDSGTVQRVRCALRTLAGAGAAILLTTRDPAEAAQADRTTRLDAFRPRNASTRKYPAVAILDARKGVALPGTDLSGPRTPLSGWRDSNPRPLAPKASALPNCATARDTPPSPATREV